MTEFRVGSLGTGSPDCTGRPTPTAQPPGKVIGAKAKAWKTPTERSFTAKVRKGTEYP